VLALEGRFEVFTIGRDTEWDKVKVIYRLGLKHGMKLAAISGANGVYSDDDIKRVVQLAKKALPRWKGGSAPASAPRKRAAAAKPAAKQVAKKAPAKKAAVKSATVKKAPAKAAKAAVKPAPARKATKPARTAA